MRMHDCQTPLTLFVPVCVAGVLRRDKAMLSVVTVACANIAFSSTAGELATKLALDVVQDDDRTF